MIITVGEIIFLTIGVLLGNFVRVDRPSGWVQVALCKSYWQGIMVCVLIIWAAINDTWSLI